MADKPEEEFLDLLTPPTMTDDERWAEEEAFINTLIADVQENMTTKHSEKEIKAFNATLPQFFQNSPEDEAFAGFVPTPVPEMMAYPEPMSNEDFEKLMLNVFEILTADKKAKISANREQILLLAASYGASDVRVVEAENKISFLVKLESGRSLLDQAGLTIDLRKLLGGYQLDVIEEGGLRGEDKENILQHATPL